MATAPLSEELATEALEAVRKYGSQAAAARALGLPRATLQSRLRTAQMRGDKAAEARGGYAPEHDLTHTVPEGFHLKGASTLYGKDGEIKLQWVKSNIDHDRMQAVLTQAAEALAADLPVLDPIPTPAKPRRDDLLNLFIVTDYHLGMLAWGEETGADWDTVIAERTLMAFFEQAARQAPNAATALVAFLGDFLHFCSLRPMTPEHGNILDADTRYYKVVQVACRVLKRVIIRLLETYPKVVVLFSEGNHDEGATPWLQVMFATLFEDNPRVEILVRPDPYYAYRFGNTLALFHHGHKRGINKGLDATLVAKFKQDFGACPHVYAHTGHLHHDRLEETHLMKVEQHRTLAAPDAHASRGGWMSGRDAKVITYHAVHGEVSRQTINIAMIEGAQL